MKKLPLILVLLGLPLAWATPLSVTYAGPPASHLGDLAPFETIARDTAVLIGNGDIAAARKRITDFEKA